MPRAPVRAASAMEALVWERDRLTTAPSETDCTVADRLVPVSPSGTGNTFMLLRIPCLALMLLAPAENPRWRRGPSRVLIFMRAPLAFWDPGIPSRQYPDKDTRKNDPGLSEKNFRRPPCGWGQGSATV